MALRDTSWITDSHAILIDYSREEQRVYAFPSGTYKRTITRKTEKWICLTEAAATNYADTHAGDTNQTHRVNEDVRELGAYNLTRITDSKSSWTSI